jgi:hypothetical protein
MKQHNKVKRLATRQKAYDDLVKTHPEYRSCYKRPGSLKK